ncbi:MAG: hypothetical protein AAF830_13960 [Pseudomonadota bacterium]
MSDLNEPFKPELRGVLQRAYSRAKGSSNSVDYGQKQLRAQSLATKLRSHIQKHKHTWIAAEAKKLNRQIPQHHRFSRAGGPKPPPGAVPSQTIRTECIKDIAEMRVRARCDKRIQNIRNLAWSRDQKSAQSQTPTRERSRSRST